MTKKLRDHGGGLDFAITKYGGQRDDWVDLSTGINPQAYPLRDVPEFAWTSLPDRAATDHLYDAARKFWNVPEGASIVAASGVSALISQLPGLCDGDGFSIHKPTYNEHEAAFRNADFDLTDDAATKIFVHPNNPDGQVFSAQEIAPDHNRLTIIDESFCDCAPDLSHIAMTGRPDVIVLKGLGKFWGLAGMRLGFAIGSPDLISNLTNRLGPWAVSGPALHIGAAALQDVTWAEKTRLVLATSARRLDGIVVGAGLDLVGGTDLFRLYSCSDSTTVFEKLATNHILTRVFPYSKNWIRIGLPHSERDWRRLEQILGD